VFYPEDYALPHRIMALKTLLDLEGGDIDAAHLDQVVGPAGVPPVPVFVLPEKVVRVDPVVADKGLLRLFVLQVVEEAHRVGADVEYPRLPPGYLLPLAI